MTALPRHLIDPCLTKMDAFWAVVEAWTAPPAEAMDTEYFATREEADSCARDLRAMQAGGLGYRVEPRRKKANA